MRIAVVLIAFFASFAALDAATAATFTFTKIANSGFLPSSIDNSGRVLFMRSVPGSQREIVIGDGVTTTQVAISGPTTPYQRLHFLPKMNDAGDVVFAANLNGGGQGLFRASADGSTVEMANINGPFQSLVDGSVLTASINDSGEVAFRARLDTVFESSVNLVSTSGLVEVAKLNGIGGGKPDINNSGQVVFVDSLPGLSGFGIYLREPGGVAATIFDTESSGFSYFGSDVAINDAGDVAITVGLAGSGGASTLILLSAGQKTIISNFATEPFALNNMGDLAFTSVINDEFGNFAGRTLNLYSNGELSSVLSSGDVLDGLVVFDILLTAGVMNDSGQIAFVVQFVDETTAIFRSSFAVASEVPIPPALLIFGAGIGCLGLMARRKRQLRQSPALRNALDAGHGIVFP